MKRSGVRKRLSRHVISLRGVSFGGALPMVEDESKEPHVASRWLWSSVAARRVFAAPTLMPRARMLNVVASSAWSGVQHSEPLSGQQAETHPLRAQSRRKGGMCSMMKSCMAAPVKGSRVGTRLDERTDGGASTSVAEHPLRGGVVESGSKMPNCSQYMPTW